MKYIKFNFEKLPRIMYTHRCTIDSVLKNERCNIYYELTLVHDGEMMIIADNERVILKKNHFFLAPSGYRYEARLIKKLDHSCFAFFYDSDITDIVEESEITDKQINNKVKVEIEDIYVPIFGEIKKKSSYEHINKIVESSKRKQENSNLFLGAEIIEFLSSISYSKNESEKATAGARYSETVDNYINNNYMNPNIGVNTIADNIGLCANYLCNLYKKETGKTIMNKIIETRIEKAKNLLLFNKYKIKDLAKLVGFDDANYFSAFFKKNTGLTPKEYITKNLNIK